jgi:hypothetical protein
MTIDLKTPPPTMNDEALEAALKRICSGADNVINNTLRRKIQRRDFDGYSIKLDFKAHTVTATTWRENGHNGDIFAEETEQLDWATSIELLKPVVWAVLQTEFMSEIHEEGRQQLEVAAWCRASNYVNTLSNWKKP